MKKKLLTLPMVFLMSFLLCSCGSNGETTSASEEKTIEMTEETIGNVTYGVPVGWTKKDVSADKDGTEYHFYPDEADKTYVVDMLMINVDNAIYNKQQAESYVDLFMDEFFSERNGYTGEYASYTELDISARKGSYTYDNGSFNVEVYCFLTNVDNVLIAFNWRETDKEALYDAEFDQMIKSIVVTDSDAEFSDTEFSEVQSDTGTSSFTNKYGNEDTKCVVSGCNNAIASSGDTNCCVSHSNNCLECGKYIDGDATYCMDCLSSAMESSSSSGSGSGCSFSYADGSLCGASVNQYAPLCDYHFNQLNDTYNSYTN